MITSPDAHERAELGLGPDPYVFAPAIIPPVLIEFPTDATLAEIAVAIDSAGFKLTVNPVSMRIAAVRR